MTSSGATVPRFVRLVLVFLERRRATMASIAPTISVTMTTTRASAAYRMTSLWLADIYKRQRIERHLTRREQLVLSVLLEKSAFDSDHLVPTKYIASRVTGTTTGKCPLKHVIVGLRKRQYVDTLVGRGGGCWLTPLGRRRAEQL